MIASEIRANARKSLTGKWGKAALMVLAYMLIIWVISFVCGLIPVIGPIVLFVISTPISYGFIASFMKLKRGEEVGYVDFLNNGFSSFGKVWSIVGHTILKMIIPVCLYILSIILTVGTTVFNSINDLTTSSASITTAGSGFIAMISTILMIVAVIYLTVKSLLYVLSNFILHDNPDMTGKQIVEESER